MHCYFEYAPSNIITRRGTCLPTANHKLCPICAFEFVEHFSLALFLSCFILHFFFSTFLDDFGYDTRKIRRIGKKTQNDYEPFEGGGKRRGERFGEAIRTIRWEKNDKKLNFRLDTSEELWT